MPITDKHPDYNRMSPTWDECGAGMAGQAAVKKEGPKLLPATPGMVSSWSTGVGTNANDSRGAGERAYDAYRLRARYDDVARESLEGVLGVLFGKDPKGTLDEVVTNDQLTVEKLARSVAKAVYSKGRRILVAEAPTDANSQSLPWIAQYCAETLINWKHDNQGDLTLAVFEEKIPDPQSSGDKYSHQKLTVYREYDLEAGTITLLDHDETILDQWPLGVELLPIVIIGSTGCSGEMDIPPVARIVECAMAAYRNSADYQQAMYLTAQPTPYSVGCSKDQFDKNNASGIGAGTHWYMGDAATARASFLEFEGKGVDAIRKSIEAELAKAAQYAVRLVHHNAVEAAEAMQIRDAAQKSSISMLADSVSEGVNKALELLSGRTARVRRFDEFELQIQDAQTAEATMITAIGNQVMAGNYPAIVGYNYAVKANLFQGDFNEWLDQIATTGYAPVKLPDNSVPDAGDDEKVPDAA